jgi:two-component system LytT family response regulator
MIKTIIVDDEPLARGLLLNYCKRQGNIEVIAQCQNGFEAVKEIDALQPDLIFLDVQMPKLSGFEVLELITHQPKVIFSTAFDQYAVKAFDANAVDYLLKPFMFDRFNQAVEKVMLDQVPIDATVISDFSNEEIQRIVIKEQGKIEIIELQQIIHIEAYDDYVKLHTDEGRFVKKQTMAHYEKTLGDDFVRIHRSHIIAISRIDKILQVESSKYLVKLTNGVEVPISRSALPILKERLGW